MPVYMMRRAAPPITVPIRNIPMTSSKSIVRLSELCSRDRVIPSKIARMLLHRVHNSYFHAL
jgi:hypothetical protein